MRKDIKAINEAYLKATSFINEQVQRYTPNLDQIYRGYPHDRLIEVSHPSYLDVEDENAEPVDVLFVFLYEPGDAGDYDTPPTSDSLEFLGSFYNDEYVDINEDDVYEATAKAQQEIAAGEDEEGSYEGGEYNEQDSEYNERGVVQHQNLLIKDVLDKFDEHMNELNGAGSPDYDEILNLIHKGDIEEAVNVLGDSYFLNNGEEIPRIEDYLQSVYDDIEFIMGDESPLHGSGDVAGLEDALDSEDEEYGHEIGSESDEQRLNRLYDEYDEALMRDDMASAREIGLEIAELTGDQNDDEYGSHESEEYGDEHNYV